MSNPTDADLSAQYHQHAEDMREREERERAERDQALMTTPLEPLEKVRGRLGRFWQIAAEIHGGLEGRPFSWRAVDVQHARPILRAMNITLVTSSRAAKLGFALKKGARPVGAMYFTAPISRQADVYVLECQFNREEEEKA